jgi:hypothetical protein
MGAPVNRLKHAMLLLIGSAACGIGCDDSKPKESPPPAASTPGATATAPAVAPAAPAERVPPVGLFIKARDVAGGFSVYLDGRNVADVRALETSLSARPQGASGPLLIEVPADVTFETVAPVLVTAAKANVGPVLYRSGDQKIEGDLQAGRIRGRVTSANIDSMPSFLALQVEFKEGKSTAKVPGMPGAVDSPEALHATLTRRADEFRNADVLKKMVVTVEPAPRTPFIEALKVAEVARRAGFKSFNFVRWGEEGPR